ncbi:MAG TPA: protein kinase [Streptosporangiales bacterium]
MQIGQLVAGRYRLEEQIGSGGMGVVWRATDLTEGRSVAIKRGHTPGDERSRRKTEREAKIAASLHHPNIVELYDVVADGDDRWLIMEYVPSRSLAALVETGGRLPPGQVARLGTQLASALAAVHAQGVVHRDVKPGNVLVTDDGDAKLADFGISRAIWSEVTAPDTGSLIGTPEYMAPEVAQGGDPTAASDVFSLGATLYCAVEGRSPFGGDANPLRALHRAASGTMPTPEHAGGLTPVLAELMRAEPARRPDAASAWRRLRPVAGNGTAPLVQARRRRRFLVPAAAVVAVLAVVAAGAALARGRAPDDAGPAASSHRAGPAVATMGDARTADPCGLVDAGALRRYGDAQLDPHYGNFNRCDVLVTSGGSEVDVEVDLETAASGDGLPPGRREHVGGLTVVRRAERDGECDRAVQLADRSLVFVSASQDDGHTSKLCAMADAATATATAVLRKGAVPRRTVPFAANSVARLKACDLLDQQALDRIGGIRAVDHGTGFGDWECDWQSVTNGTGVQLRFDQSSSLSPGGDGTLVRIGGRKTFVIRNGEGPGTCLLLVVNRTFQAGSGDSIDELVYLNVTGHRPVAELCTTGADLVRVIAPELPRA